MRIWSLHPKYLDAKGLVALWRETLLAKHVLEGKTKGYKNHPQLLRFKKADQPLARINEYLSFVFEEAKARKYNFNAQKFEENFEPGMIEVTSGQIDYEKKHLLGKLEIRDIEKFHLLSNETHIELHPMFTQIEGDIEGWEVIN